MYENTYFQGKKQGIWREKERFPIEYIRSISAGTISDDERHVRTREPVQIMAGLTRPEKNTFTPYIRITLIFHPSWCGSMPDAKGQRGLWEALESILRERGEIENLERLRKLFPDETRKWWGAGPIRSSAVIDWKSLKNDNSNRSDHVHREGNK